VAAPGPAGPDPVGPDPVGAASRALFAPAEEVLGTFDAVTAHPYIRQWGQRWLGLGFCGLVFLSLVGLIGGFSRFSFVLNHPGTYLGVHEFLVVGLLGAISTAYCTVTGARRVVFSLTTQGLVECRVDALGRPRTVASRSPAVAPRLLREGRVIGYRQVALGERVVWVSRRLDPVMSWMTSTTGQAG
jgi:hypothetical protein